ncbi:MAG: hypothetical protein FJ246_06820 [Nitrospira sp.]|nr:hypothetical protein [Nitrospira sp.]
MKPANESPLMSQQEATPPAPRIPIDPSLHSLFNRLDALSQEPTFLVQRQLALSLALRPYAEYAQRLPWFPLPEELELAGLYLYADFYPEDGQLSLIERVRDTIEVHVPQEERAWLDPLRHSYMDLLEILSVEDDETGRLILRSLGDGLEFRVAAGAFSRTVTAGQALLTRLIRLPDRAVLAGSALIVSAAHAQAIYRATDEWRRQMEAESGSFDLGEWQEFAKRYGHILLWQFAQARLMSLIRADERVRYRTPDGRPVLYALAQYDHREFRFLADGLPQIEGLVADSPGKPGARRVWVQRERQLDAVVARLTLTPSLLTVECDSRERLDGLKHRLASAFGFALHFMGESTTVPAHALPQTDLTVDDLPSVSVVVTEEEDRRRLAAFSESVYLEWADRPAPALGGLTPRHAATSPDGKTQAAALIAQLEQDDLALRRTGQPGYDYNRLRAHVGL